jgi:hypothetical protein
MATTTPTAAELYEAGVLAVPTTELQPGDTIEVTGVSYMKNGPAVVREVSRKTAPTGAHWIGTSRGTFLAMPEALHEVIG